MVFFWAEAGRITEKLIADKRIKKAVLFMDWLLLINNGISKGKIQIISEAENKNNDKKNQ
jgi:hypothetical protein